jgi:hypothetical protein
MWAEFLKLNGMIDMLRLLYFVCGEGLSWAEDLVISQVTIATDCAGVTSNTFRLEPCVLMVWW